MNLPDRILFLNPWDRLIGPNRYLAEALRNVPDLASRSTVVFHEINNAIQEYRDLGCQVSVWPEIKLIHPRVTLSNLEMLLLNHTRGLAHILRRMHALRPGVVVSNSEIILIGGMAARLLKIPHLQVVHSLLSYHWAKSASMIRLYTRWMSLWADRFIGVSQTVRQMLLDYGIDEKKTVVVPNGFDVHHIRKRSELPLPADVRDLIQGRYPVIVSVGRIAPMKGQDVLLEAVDRIRGVYPSLICLVVGRNGADESVEDWITFRQRLTRFIDARRLQACVHFLGEVDYLFPLFRHADLYIHPSWTESFSRVVAEALLCSRPVVCTDVGGLPEVAGPSGALLVRAGDAEALARGVIQVLGNRSLGRRMATFGQAYVEKHYPILTTTEKLFHTIVSATKTRARHVS